MRIVSAVLDDVKRPLDDAHIYMGNYAQVFISLNLNKDVGMKNTIVSYLKSYTVYNINAVKNMFIIRNTHQLSRYDVSVLFQI